MQGAADKIPNPRTFFSCLIETSTKLSGNQFYLKHLAHVHMDVFVCGFL